MDTLTHALSGALVAAAIAKPEGAVPLRASLLTGFAAAAFPDIDILLRLTGDLIYLNEHRGVTHSLLLLPLWAGIAAWLCSVMSRRRYGWQALYPACLGGIAIHIAGDVITSYGTKLFAPWSAHEYAYPVSFVIDFYFSAIIVLGLCTLHWRPSRGIAYGALGVLLVYVLFQSQWRQEALQLAVEAARRNVDGGAVVQVLPQPFSPLHWMLIVVERDAYRVAFVDLHRTDPEPVRARYSLWQLPDAYRGRHDLVWFQYRRPAVGAQDRTFETDAWNHGLFADYRRFAQLPALDAVTEDAGTDCAWFFDLRFLLPGSPPSFRYGMCRAGNPGDDWRVVKRAGGYWID